MTISLCSKTSFQKYSRVLSELAKAKPLSISYQQSWLTGEVPDDWRIANVTPIYKKDQKEDPRKYRPVNLTSLPGKIMEHFILSVLTGHGQDNKGIRPSQHGSIKGRSCLTTESQNGRGWKGPLWVI